VTLTATYIVPGERLLIKKHTVDEQTESGLYIPSLAQQAPSTADVVLVGAAVVDIVPGDVVHFNKYAGTPVTYEGDEHLVIFAKDVVFIERG